ESSKAASVLILRFFLGFYPDEIALIIRAPIGTVAVWLRYARTEATVAAVAPGRLHVLSSSDVPAIAPLGVESTTDDCLRAFREAMAASRRGTCRPRSEWESLYRDDAGAVDCATLAHLVSCPVCLDEVSEILDRPQMSDRDPTDMLGPHRSAPTRGAPPSGRN